MTKKDTGLATSEWRQCTNNQVRGYLRGNLSLGTRQKGAAHFLIERKLGKMRKTKINTLRDDGKVLGDTQKFSYNHVGPIQT